MFPGGVEGPTSGLSQQSGEAEGSMTLEVQGRAASGLDDDGTAWDCQTGPVRQARQTGATQVNHWWNPVSVEPARIWWIWAGVWRADEVSRGPVRRTAGDRAAAVCPTHDAR